MSRFADRLLGWLSPPAALQGEAEAAAVAEARIRREVRDIEIRARTALRERMDAWIAKREAETGFTNPMRTQGDWHGHKGVGPFKTSQQAYDTLYIGDLARAIRMQAQSREEE